MSKNDKKHNNEKLCEEVKELTTLKKLKRTLSLALAILLMLATPMASLAAEELPAEEEKIETVVDIEESSEEMVEIEDQQIVVEEETPDLKEEKEIPEEPEEIEEEFKQEDENADPVAEEVEEELLGASEDTIYWGIKDGVLRISAAEVGGDYSGSFPIKEPSCDWYEYRDGITEVFVGDERGTVRPTDMRGWFYYLSNVEEINFVKIDTSNVTSMERLFGYCYNLKSLDVSDFDTGNVTNMHEMFMGCENLESLDVGNFDTGKVTDMGYMFEACISLKSIDISRFVTSKVTCMDGMFRYCISFNNIDLSSLDTSNVTSMYGMFEGCLKIGNLDVSNFDTGDVTNMHRMFHECESLESIDLSSFDTRKVEDMMVMFDDCSKLRKIYVGDGFSTESLNAEWRDDSMFDGCINLVGGSGTAYSEYMVDSTYARIDDPENNKPGYFTQAVSINILSPSPETDPIITGKVEVKAQIKGVPEGTDIIFRIEGMDGFVRVQTDENGIVANKYNFKNEGNYTVEIAYEDQVASVEIPVTPVRPVRMILFETNGGSKVSLQLVMDNDLAIKPEDPTKPGYDFAGWFLDPELTKPFDFSKPITENITLYAKWNEKSKDTPSSGNASKTLFTGTEERPVSDGTWNYDAETDTWSYRTTQLFVNTWGCITNPWNDNKPAWFIFDKNGKMLTGWQQINNEWYYLHPFKDGSGRLGECLIGPAWTPDGYEVDASGAWTGKRR